MKKVLFVCLGNICRSPTAEAVMRSIVEEAGEKQLWLIDSAGTGDWHVGEAPDSRTRQHAKKRGYDMDSLRARQISAKDLSDFDMILAMDDENLKNVSKLTKDQTLLKKVKKLTDFKNKVEANIVPDPYYCGEDGFELVLDIVEDCCQSLFLHLKNND